MSERQPDAEQASPRRFLPDGDRFAYVPSIYVALVLVLATVALVRMVAELEFLIVLLYLSILLPCGIARPVSWLERHGWRRSFAILAIYAVLCVILMGIGWFALPPLLGQLASVADDLPHHISRLERYRERLTALRADYSEIEQLDARLGDLAQDVGERIARIVVALPSAVATGIFGLSSILVFTFLFLMGHERMTAGALAMVHPRHRQVTDRVLREIANRLGAYLRAKVIIMVIVGAWMFITLRLLGSPYAVLVAIMIGFLEGIPRIGPLVGRVAMVVLLVPMGWKVMVAAVVAHVIIDNIKGYVLSPLIEGSEVDIHPLTAFIAVIAGGLLMGWVGAFVAVPTAAVIQVIIEQVVVPWRRRQLAAAEPEGNPAA